MSGLTLKRINSLPSSESNTNDVMMEAYSSYAVAEFMRTNSLMLSSAADARWYKVPDQMRLCGKVAKVILVTTVQASH